MPASCRFGQHEVRPLERLLLVDGSPAALGSRAFDLLLALIERRDRVVAKSELLDLVWPGVVVEENNLQVQVSTLRRLLGPDVIATIPGRGYQFTAAVQAQEIAPWTEASSPAATHHFPQPRTRFIGRAAALVQCASLLQQARLLTLTGIGGCGKTRLALQLAQQQPTGFADGVWFVDLAPVQDTQRVASAMAAAVGVREEAGTPLIDRLRAELATRRMLIVLDNCEHVIDAARELVDALLAACAELKIVATSRESLGVTGEQVFAVPALTLPAGAGRHPMQGSEAVQLFVDRARLVVPEFALDEHNAPAIAEICRRLDGIALAIELAAARVKMLSVEEIRSRLDDRFRLLTGGSRTLPRHQTLQATLQWSHDNLSAQEQGLFRQLAVFGGGCTLAAATRVADSADEYAVLELLTHLHDKSLLEVDREGPAHPRYRMLETVRQYARERLEEAGDADAVRHRHLEYYLDDAVTAAPASRGPDEKLSLDRFELEHDNLRAALGWALRNHRATTKGLQLAALLGRYWHVRGYFTEGRRWLSDLLAAAPADQAKRERARALDELGALGRNYGDYLFARSACEQALSLYRELGDRAGAADARGQLGLVAFHLAEYDRARPLLEESLAAQREIGNDRGVALTLNGLGMLTCEQGDFDAARAFHEESLALSRRLGDRQGVGMSLNNLALVYANRGDIDIAARLFEENLAIRRELGDSRGVALSLFNLGMVALERDDVLQSEQLVQQALAQFEYIGDRRGIALSLRSLGEIALKRSDFDDAAIRLAQALRIQHAAGDRLAIAQLLESLGRVRGSSGNAVGAARLWGAAQALREAIGAPLPPHAIQAHEQNLAAARSVDSDGLDKGWQQGRALTLDQAVAEALGTLPSVHASTR